MLHPEEGQADMGTGHHVQLSEVLCQDLDNANAVPRQVRDPLFSKKDMALVQERHGRLT